MNKIFQFLKQSNRYKHIIGGFVVAFLALGAWPAIYAAIVAASCLEFKDYLYHNRWDWNDWLCTVAGGLFASILYLFI